ncbi:MAG: hypothetical protein RIR48_2033 [Bacteroidota bacterium]
MKKYIGFLTDIRIWIFILFLLRLETINLPPLDEHSWRQCITLGVARNYAEVDATFWEPKTVISDSRNGILAQEFPILNYLIYILWSIFGEHNWVFRSLVLLVSSFGLYYFYLLLKRLFNHHIAFGTVIVFAVSIAFTYARKAMPDVFSVSLCIIAIEYAYRYKEQPGIRNGIIFTTLMALGLLSKMPAAMVLPFGFWLIDFSEQSKKKSINIILMGGLAVFAMALWYWVWVPWAEKAYQFRLFFPTSLAEGYKQLAENYVDLRLRFYPSALTSTISFVFCIAGLVAALIKKEKKVLLLFLSSTFILIFFMLKTGSVFSGHKYYIIPFVPMMSLLAGYGISFLSNRTYLFYGVLVIISFEAIIEHKKDFFVHADDKKYLRLESITDKHVPKSDRILVNSGEGQPWMMYMAHRRGWTVTDRMKDTAWVNGESSVGLKYILIDKGKWKDTIPYPVLYDDIDFRLYKVKNQYITQ